jgi:ATP-dependent helicase/nuclease subunit B
MRFHAGRESAAGDDAARLAEAATEASTELGLDEAELLPYRASFEVFAPAYLAWLARREAEGWHWQAGEIERRVAPPELAPTELRGRIDRIDRGPGGARFVLDYKTGSANSFQEQVRDPLEDTQLAFYAALLAADGGSGRGDAAAASVRAAYLALDGPEAPKLIEHEQVSATAQALIEGVGGELARLRAGAPLRALGEGRVCDYCEMRGLCRRDHWQRRP